MIIGFFFAMAVAYAVGFGHGYDAHKGQVKRSLAGQRPAAK